MNKFHISDDGVPRPCEAKNSCPVGGDSVHFSDYESAVQASENINAEKYGNLSTVKRSKEEFAPRKVDNAVSKDAFKNSSKDSKNTFFKTYNEVSKIRDEHNEKYADTNDDVDIEVGLMLNDILGMDADDMMSDDGIHAFLFDAESSDSEIEREAAERVGKMIL